MTASVARFIAIATAAAALMGAAASAHAEPAAHSFIVFFPNESAQLTGEAASVVDMTADWTKANGVTHIEIVGHTDTKEPDPDGLSERRAESVRNYLVSKGLPANVTITLRAAGSREPMAATGPNVSEPLNRGAEINVQ
jgi:OOP family OmpA-OmpF porin